MELLTFLRHTVEYTTAALCVQNENRDQTANKHEDWSEENSSGAPLSTRPSNTFKELVAFLEELLSFRSHASSPITQYPRDAPSPSPSIICPFQRVALSQDFDELADFVWFWPKINGRLLDSRAIFQRRHGDIVRIEDVHAVLQFGKVVTELKHRAIIRGITVD